MLETGFFVGTPTSALKMKTVIVRKKIDMYLPVHTTQKNRVKSDCCA
jgi:hypothetical protein